MALTQTSTNGIKDATIATADIADDAVTADKLANAINTDIAAKAVLTGSTNNTITTVTGANAIQGEANLTYDGDILHVGGGGSSADGSRLDLKHGNNNTTDVISSVTFSNTVGEAARIQGETSGANNSGVITFHTDNAGTSAERLRIDSSGRLLLGHNASIEKHRHVQLVGTGADESAYLAARFSNDANCPRFETLKSRSGTPGSNTIVQQNDEVGAIEFLADDGVEYNNQVAGIKAWIDAAPGANDTPGRLCFYTTSDGAMAQTERMRIDRHGRMYLGTTTTGDSGADDLTIATSGGTGITIRSGDTSNGSIYFSDGTSGAPQYAGFIQYAHGSDNKMYFGAGSATRMKVESNGNVTINDGDLVFATSGHGIDFSATSDVSGATSELLDDYEEGTWTPVLGSSGGSAPGNGSYETQAGTYTKIGDRVTVSCYLGWDGNWNGAGGSFAIALPFTSANSPPTYGAVYIGFLKHTNGALATANNSVGGYISGGNVLFYQIPHGTQSGTNAGGLVNNATWSHGAGYVCFTTTYRV